MRYRILSFICIYNGEKQNLNSDIKHINKYVYVTANCMEIIVSVVIFDLPYPLQTSFVLVLTHLLLIHNYMRVIIFTIKNWYSWQYVRSWPRLEFYLTISSTTPWLSTITTYSMSKPCDELILNNFMLPSSYNFVHNV